MSFSIARLGISERIQHVRSLLSHIKTQESAYSLQTRQAFYV